MGKEAGRLRGPGGGGAGRAREGRGTPWPKWEGKKAAASGARVRWSFSKPSARGGMVGGGGGDEEEESVAADEEEPMKWTRRGEWVDKTWGRRGLGGEVED